MKRLLLIFAFTVLGCTLPVQLTWEQPTTTPIPEQTPFPTQTPPVTPGLGTSNNPVILALNPSPQPGNEMINAGRVIAAFIEMRTGYKVVTVIPPSESKLVETLDVGNAHIAALPPFAYLLAYENGTVTAMLGSVHQGKTFYGAQFIANRDGGFTSFYDTAGNQNTADANMALLQFQDKKPCWSDQASPSAYVVPLGLLKQAKVEVRSGAFLEGQPSVVRAVYTADICDFGATFIDARQSPVLEANYPDVMDKVVVIWRTPEIIPYANISISTSLPLEMRRVIQRAFIDLMLTRDGKAAIQTAYGFDELQVVDDSMYDAFRTYVKDSKVNLQDVVEKSQP